VLTWGFSIDSQGDDLLQRVDLDLNYVAAKWYLHFTSVIERERNQKKNGVLTPHRVLDPKNVASKNPAPIGCEKVRHTMREYIPF
jgi:hypothetical protein